MGERRRHTRLDTFSKIMKPLILASQSPRRKQLLEMIGVPFTCIVHEIEEYVDTSLPIVDALQQLAIQKGQEVAKQNPDSVVVSADTMVALGNTVLGKPKDEQEAKQMLQRLSNNTHIVYSAVAIFVDGKVKTFCDQSEVCFYDLNESLIDAYIAKGGCLDKAGAYGIQDAGALFVKSIQGDYYTIVGLPIARLYRELQKI